MIKTIIFDFGDVLVTDAAKRFREKYIMKLPKKQRDDYYELFHRTETGKHSTKELLKALHELVPTLSIKEIREDLLSTKVLPPWNLAQKLSKKYQVIILSNNQKSWPRLQAKRAGIQFGKIPFIDSAEVGMRKPHLSIYKYALKRFKINPKTAVFIDDHKENLVPARKLGIKTFCFQNNSTNLKKFLKKNGVYV